MVCKINVENVPGEMELSGKWIVARQDKGYLWYWGSYETIARAKEVAEEIGGVVVWM